MYHHSQGAGEAGPVEVLGSSKTEYVRHMELHHLLGHPSEGITRGTARAVGVHLSGTWNPCVECSEARVRRYTVPKITNYRANRRAGIFFVDLTGPFHDMSLTRSRYAMLCVEDWTRLKEIRLLHSKSDSAAALSDVLKTHIALLGLEVGTIRTDRGSGS